MEKKNNCPIFMIIVGLLMLSPLIISIVIYSLNGHNIIQEIMNGFYLLKYTILLAFSIIGLLYLIMGVASL
jgi:hypothetical protein